MGLKRFFLLSLVFSVLLGGRAFGEELLCEEKQQIKEGSTEIIIRTNTPNTFVYLNGQLQGKTELKIKGLREGTYSLKLKKRGYETVDFEISVKKSLRQFFYTELKEAEATEIEIKSGNESSEESEGSL